MLICDGGTTYSKIYNVHTGDLEILPTKDLILKKTVGFNWPQAIQLSTIVISTSMN